MTQKGTAKKTAAKKDDRLTIVFRVRPEAAALIDQAAGIRAQLRREFVRQTVILAARQIVEEEKGGES